jgi:vancomycin resistance protein YoaR
MLALVAGIIFLSCAFSYRLPRGVYVNGCNVGGLSLNGAQNLLREQVENGLKGKELHICADERIYTYTFPEIYYSDNFYSALLSIRKRGEYFADVHYYLNGVNEVADYIAKYVERELKEPYAQMNKCGEPFCYYDGNDGVVADRQRLIDEINHSLNDDWHTVTLNTKIIKRQFTTDEARDRTVLLSTYTTYFDGSNVGRSANIKLAADKINTDIVAAGETFSFNGAVGERTQANGYKSAKIIEGGKFVDGVGGGVCQVSTTLYNAAVLAGLQIEEYHPHSLAVNYVPPSRDAMVSGNYFDLKFKNNALTPIYVRVNCTRSSITCSIYGKSDGWKYSYISEVTGQIEQPPDVIVEGEEDKFLVCGRAGTLSRAYLIAEKAGEVVKKFERVDRYGAVANVVQKKLP